MTVEPIHLKCSELPYDDFEPDEKIYHRLHVDKPPVNPHELFSIIQGKNLTSGLSVNRSKFSNIEDTYWTINEIMKNGEKTCEYEIKDKKICIEGYVKNVHEQKQKGHLINCDKTPFVCNKAHCDINFDPQVNANEKEIIINLKAYLSSVFIIAEAI